MSLRATLTKESWEVYIYSITGGGNVTIIIDANTGEITAVHSPLR
jgi:hypothetical protein